MKTIAATTLILFALVTQALAGTRVWGFYGLGDNWWNTSIGIDQIAAEARKLPHVTAVRILPYWATQQAVDEMNAAPAHDRIVGYGYSCGSNALTVIAAGLRRHIDIATIQPSVWCGGRQLTSNVRYAKNVYAPICIFNIGLGCRWLRLAPGNTTTELVHVRRQYLHSWADTDPKAQAEVLAVIRHAPNAPRGEHEIVR
jgi:hypothetical protein